mmetsp:Transcript_5515/g.34117  ORF Transcript_5515/g.34117 Transcript_5515/m.34117 type:complete len:368 (+) Transcript_5515:705-1808(+)
MGGGWGDPTCAVPCASMGTAVVCAIRSSAWVSFGSDSNVASSSSTSMGGPSHAWTAGAGRVSATWLIRRLSGAAICNSTSSSHVFASSSCSVRRFFGCTFLRLFGERVPSCFVHGSDVTCFGIAPLLGSPWSVAVSSAAARSNTSYMRSTSTSLSRIFLLFTSCSLSATYSSSTACIRFMGASLGVRRVSETFPSRRASARASRTTHRRASRHVLLLPKGVQRAHASFFFQVLRHQLRRFRHQPTLALPRPNANHTSRFPRPNRNLARRAHAPPPSSCSSSSSSSSCCCSTSSPPSSSCCCSSPPSSSTSSSSSSSSLERYATSGTVATDGRTRTCDDGWMRLRESPRPSWTMPQGGSAVVRRRTWR